MKLRIQQRPSITGRPFYWYHAQVKRFGIWIDCKDDPILMLRCSTDMMVSSWDMDIEKVKRFVEHALRKEEMYPKTNNTVVAEYES